MESDDFEPYKIKTFQVLIEFFYDTMRGYMISHLAPIYLCNLVTFLVLAQINEHYRE